MEERPEEAREPVAPSRSARPWLLAAAALSAAALAAFVTWKIVSRRAPASGPVVTKLARLTRDAARSEWPSWSRTGASSHSPPTAPATPRSTCGAAREARTSRSRTIPRRMFSRRSRRTAPRSPSSRRGPPRPASYGSAARSAQRADVRRRPLGRAGPRRSGEAHGPGRELPRVAARRIRHPLRHGPGEPPRDHGGACEGRPAASGPPERGVGLRALPDRVLPERQVDQSRDAAGRPPVDAGRGGKPRRALRRASVTRGMSRRAACTSSTRTLRAAAASSSSRRATILSPPSRARSAS